MKGVQIENDEKVEIRGWTLDDRIITFKNGKVSIANVKFDSLFVNIGLLLGVALQ